MDTVKQDRWSDNLYKEAYTACQPIQTFNRLRVAVV